MALETYYTIRRIQSPCRSGSAVLFELTYPRVAAELSDEDLSCDFKSH